MKKFTDKERQIMAIKAMGYAILSTIGHDIPITGEKDPEPISAKQAGVKATTMKSNI